MRVLKCFKLYSFFNYVRYPVYSSAAVSYLLNIRDAMRDCVHLVRRQLTVHITPGADTR
jgi:hypothetical protein